MKKSIKLTLDACRFFAHLGGVDFFGEIIFAVYLKMTKLKKLTPPRCAKSDISKKRALTEKSDEMAITHQESLQSKF